MQRKILVFICVTAGKQESVSKTVSGILKQSGIRHRLVMVDKPTDIQTAGKKLAIESYEAVAVYGGDGTVIQACKLLTGRATPLLILPGGTANVLANYFKLPGDLEACLNLYINQTFIIARNDLASINDIPFVLDMHTGVWTEAIISTPRSLKKRIGKAAYGLSAIKKAATHKPFYYVFSLNNQPEQTVRAHTLLIANQGDHSVLGARLFPYEHAPGMVQLALLKDLRPTRLICWLVWKKLTGRHLRRVISVHRASTVAIYKAPRTMLVDDTKARAEFPLTITGGQYGIRLIVPPAETNRSGLKMLLRKNKIIAHRVAERAKVMFFRSGPSLRYSHVAPGVYLGGKYPSSTYRTFSDWGITGIISMRMSLTSSVPIGIDLLHLPTRDWQPPSLEDLSKGVEFIAHHIKRGGAVYIHCQLGEGRGPTMAAAYLISRGLTVDEAIAQLIKYRPFVQPNSSQQKRLAEWQEQYNQTSRKHIKRR